MGLSSSKKTTVQSNDPWVPAQPYILKGLEQSGAVFDQQQPTLNKYAGMQMDTYGRMAPGAEAGIVGSQKLVNSTLNGDYLNGNPYLEGVIGKTRNDITDQVNSQFSAAGRYGSGMYAGVLGSKLADAENSLRFQNYDTERNRQMQALDQAQSLMGGSQSLLNNAAELPWIGVGALNGNVRQASNGYGTSTSTTKSTPSLMDSIQQGLAIGSKAASLFSDRRLKTDIEPIGVLEDGLPFYKYRYLWESEPREGVMADEVAHFRPWALGPEINGFATVNYEAL